MAGRTPKLSCTTRSQGCGTTASSKTSCLIVASTCSPDSSHKLNHPALATPCIVIAASRRCCTYEGVCGMHKECNLLSQLTERKGFSGSASCWLWACADAARDRVPAEVQPGITLQASESEAECLFVTLHTLQVTSGLVRRYCLVCSMPAWEEPVYLCYFCRNPIGFQFLSACNKGSVVHCELFWDSPMCAEGGIVCYSLDVQEGGCLTHMSTEAWQPERAS